jgi:hypothetical protein
MRIFDRSYSLTVGDRELSELAFSFQVQKSLKPEPNTCEIKIYNLAPETRQKFESATANAVRIEAGYGGDNSQIYLGEVRAAWTTIEGADVVTTLSTGDSEKEIQTARINVSIGAKAPADVALRALVRALGVKSGNVEHAVRVLQTKGVAAGLFPSGTVLSGQVHREMTDFCRSANLEWSVQDGAIQILDKGKALEGKAVVLASDTGLYGSPTVDSKGIVTARCALIPELRPGVKVVLDAIGVKGGYRVHTCEYVGDTWGDSWDCTITAQKYASSLQAELALRFGS